MDYLRVPLRVPGAHVDGVPRLHQPGGERAAKVAAAQHGHHLRALSRGGLGAMLGGRHTRRGGGLGGVVELVVVRGGQVGAAAGAEGGRAGAGDLAAATEAPERGRTRAVHQVTRGRSYVYYTT